MSTRANHFKLGVFVLVGVGAILGALLLLGLGSTYKQPVMVETYLDQSVQGLEVGSKVNYRGVHFGTVSSVSFSRIRYEEGKPAEEQKRYVLIEVAVEDEMVGHAGREAFLAFLRTEVAKGLRFRLNSQGITGLSYLELDYVDPTRYPPLAFTWTPEHPHVPSAPGTLTRLLTSAEQVFRKLEGVDLAQVLTNLNRVLMTAEREVSNLQIGVLAGQATNLLAELRETNRSLQGVLGDPRMKEIPGHAADTLKSLKSRIDSLDLEGVIGRAERMLGSVEGLLAGKEPELAATLANLKALSENLKLLSEGARNHPAGLLLGLPPKPVQGAP